MQIFRSGRTTPRRIQYQSRPPPRRTCRTYLFLSTHYVSSLSLAQAHPSHPQNSFVQFRQSRMHGRLCLCAWLSMLKHLSMNCRNRSDDPIGMTECAHIHPSSWLTNRVVIYGFCRNEHCFPTHGILLTLVVPCSFPKTYPVLACPTFRVEQAIGLNRAQSTKLEHAIQQEAQKYKGQEMVFQVRSRYSHRAQGSRFSSSYR